jgi:MSHA pilin protein MshD
MWSKQRGFTLVEMILAIVVLGVGLAGVMLAFSTTTRGSGDVLVQRQLLAIAQGLLDEALSRPYAPVAGGGSVGCERSAFNDVADYNGYSRTGICTIDGAPIASLSSYGVSVRVAPDNLGGVSAALRVTVSARRGAEELELVGWRTGYAP